MTTHLVIERIVDLSDEIENPIPHQVPVPKIVRATYGKQHTWLDVTPIINDLIQRSTDTITVSNHLFTDPLYGVVKELRLVFDDGHMLIVEENQTLNLKTLI